MMQLHHFPLSSNSRRVRMAAVALGAELEEKIVDLAKGEHRRPEYLALNPGGRVPTLVDGDFVLTESHAIIAYLADRMGPSPLYPTELQARADVNRWMFWTASHLMPGVGTLNFERMIRRMTGAGAPDPREEERGERLVTECARLLDAHLARHEWLAQGRLTLADLSVAAPFMSKIPARLPIDSYAHLGAWFDRMQKLDAWQRTAPAL